MKSFWDCCSNTYVLMAGCYGREATLLLVRSLCPCRRSQITTVNRWCWIPNSVCAVTTPLHSLNELDRPSQPSRRGCHGGLRQDQPFAMCGRFSTNGIFSTRPPTCANPLSAACDQAGMKYSIEKTEVLFLSGNITVYVLSERQYAAEGGKVEVPWGCIQK